jgi:hypothetical protein
MQAKRGARECLVTEDYHWGHQVIADLEKVFAPHAVKMFRAFYLASLGAGTGPGRMGYPVVRQGESKVIGQLAVVDGEEVTHGNLHIFVWC